MVFFFSSIHSLTQSPTVDLMRTWWSFVNTADIVDTFRIDWPCLRGKPARGNMISLRHHHQLCDTWEIPGSSERHSELLFSSRCLRPEQSSMSLSCEQRSSYDFEVKYSWLEQNQVAFDVSALFWVFFFPWLMFQTFHAEDSDPVTPLFWINKGNPQKVLEQFKKFLLNDFSAFPQFCYLFPLFHNCFIFSSGNNKSVSNFQ